MDPTAIEWTLPATTLYTTMNQDLCYRSLTAIMPSAQPSPLHRHSCLVIKKINPSARWLSQQCLRF